MKALRPLLASALLLAAVTLHAQQRINFPLSAWTTGISTMWDGNPIIFYGFSKAVSSPTLPGPTIRCNEGDTVVIEMTNRSQGSHHTIHLHGLDVDQANDGVPHTSFAIGHQEDSTYTFVATKAGTYFYHCHVLSIWHVQLGMYGSIIVNAANGANTVWTGGPAFDSEFNWLTSEVDQNWFDSIPIQHSGDSTFETIPVLRYDPEYFLVNGKSRQVIDTLRTVRVLANTGARVHLRVGNMGYHSNRITFPPALNAEIVASDGRPLPAPMIQDTLWVYPGERYSILLDMAGPQQDSIHMSWHDLFTEQQHAEEFIPVIHGVGIARDEAEAPLLRLEAYPQPANDWVHMRFETLRQLGEWQLTDMAGQVLKAGKSATGHEMLSFQVADLPAGIYHWQMASGARRGSTRIAVMR